MMVLGSRAAMGYVLGRGAGAAGNGLLTGLISFWTLDETSGARADSHGSNTLSVVGSPSYRTGKIGNAVDIPASSSYLSAGTAIRLVAGNSLTVAAWVYADTLSTYGYPVARWGSTNGDYGLYVLSNGAGFAAAYSLASSSVAQTTGMTTGAWRLLIGWFDHSVGANGTLYIQLDNNSPASQAMAGAHTSSTSETLAIGKLGINPFGNFDGAVDNVAIWSRVLSAADRATLWNSGAGLAYSSFTA